MKIRTCHLIQTAIITAAFGLAAPNARAGDRDAARQPRPVIVDPAVIARHRALGHLGERNTTALRNSGSTVTIVERSAFDWGAAGVGAAGAFGLMLVASGLVIVRRHSPAGGQRSGARRG